jgi:hypothetical protein
MEKVCIVASRSFGLRRRIDPSPADVALDADHDAWRRGSLGYRFFEVWEHSPRRSRFTMPPGASLHPARNCRRCIRLFGKSDHPSDHVGVTFGIPFANLTDFPSVLHPEGLRFLGVLLGCPGQTLILSRLSAFLHWLILLGNRQSRLLRAGAQ